MGGGLLNLISKGSEDIILTGNPDISFFKHVYKKYSNYGSQYFRIDYTGLRSLSYKNDTVIEFTVPRHADLLGDTYFVVNLPDIYSQPPIHNNKYCPKFKWIRDIGYNMIKRVTISIGGQKINDYSGEYFINLRDREYYSDKREKINEMTGNIPELYDPSSTYNGVYPNAFKSTNFEPSIRGRKLYIPIDCWFGHDSHMHLPLVSLQYHEVNIRIELRPINELYVVANELLDEYTENFLFNEYPAMHNVNFLLKSKGLGDDSLCKHIKDTLTNNFKRYKDTIDDDMFDNSLYPDKDPLTAAVQEYTDSIISFIQNGDNNVPNTIQHTGTGNTDVDTDNLFVIRVHSIKHTNFYKVYIYIDIKRLVNIDSLNTFCTYLKTDKYEKPYIYVEPFLYNKPYIYALQDYEIMRETVSLYTSTDVQTSIIPNFISTVNDFSSINVGFPDNIERNYNSNKRAMLQDKYVGKKKYIKYAAPEYVTISNTNINEDDTLYSIHELIGQSELDISYFTLDKAKHLDKSWNADMHLISKYVFLDDAERSHYAKTPQSYLIKTVYEHEHNSLLVPNTIKIDTKDLVINYMWNYRRSDVHLRNEWSNYTNWEFTDIPNAPLSNEINGITYPFFITPYIGNIDNNNNKKSILKSLSVIIDGKVRENIFEQGVYNNIEKYLKCAGQGKDGQYFYSFALNNNPTDLQPSGTMNMTRFKDISFEFTLTETPNDTKFDPTTVTRNVLQTPKGRSAPICVSSVTKKDHTKLYSFDMKTYSERYNVLAFNSGMAGLMFAR
jgi:hypothetical protein